MELLLMNLFVWIGRRWFENVDIREQDSGWVTRITFSCDPDHIEAEES